MKNGNTQEKTEGIKNYQKKMLELETYNDWNINLLDGLTNKLQEPQ